MTVGCIITNGTLTPPESAWSSPKVPQLDINSLYDKFHIKLVTNDLMPNATKIKQDGPFTWDEIKLIVSTNKLELFARSYAQTQSYLDFKKHLKGNNLSIQQYLLDHELHWDPRELEPDHRLFSDENDVKILLNKFPYYFDKNVVHLCIWTKKSIPNDPNSPVGDISPQTKRLIQTYIDKTFKGYDLVWFRNWSALQSVRAISHIHVIVKDIDQLHLEELLDSPGNLLNDDDYALLGE